MAYQLALKNNLAHPFRNETAGHKWLRLFLKRHPELTLRKPENLSIARIKGFSEENVAKFYSILKPELEKIKYDPTKIFNVDETGISVVQHKLTSIVCAKGKKSIQKLSSGERGATVTVVSAMSAAGQHIPPLLIFPQKRWQPQLIDRGQ